MRVKAKGFLSVIILFSMVHTCLNAQDDLEIEDNLGWKISLNFGLYVPHNYTANYYNGNSGNENTLSYIFDNPYHYEDIFNLLNASDTFFVTGIPQKMSYQTALGVGFTVRNNFREDMSWYIQFNQVKLEAKDVFTLEVDPLTIGIFPDLRSYSIWGVEQRYKIDFGIGKEFALEKSKNRPFIDLGITMTNTKVLENKIVIEDQEYDIINVFGSQNWVPNSNMQTFEVEQGGLGFGCNISGGIKLYINNYFSLDPMVHIYLNTINLKDYKKLKPNLFLNLRLSINNLFLYSQSNSSEDIE